MNQDLLQTLNKLISFKSVTPKSAGSIEYIANFLSELGFECEIKTFGSQDEEVTNLYAILGNSSPNICFAGHVDVVPPGNEDSWSSDPFSIKIDGDFIYGRGAVDMKGAIACYMIAVQEFLRNCTLQNGSISFLITSDEEGDGKNGTIKMLEHIKNHDPKIDFCILGEPTNKENIGDTIKIGRRGSVNFDLKIKGKQGHVAYPEKAINPMGILTDILSDLNNINLDKGTEYFLPSNLEVTSIDTRNTVNNVIPNEVDVKFNIRFNDLHNAESLYNKIDEIISKNSKDYELKYKSSSDSFIQKYSEKMKNFTEIVKSSCNTLPNVETGGGTSDARFIHQYAEVVEFGLNCNSAHKINEYTKNSDLQLIYNVYYKCLTEFLSWK